MKKILCCFLLFISHSVLSAPDLMALINTSWQKIGVSAPHSTLRFDGLSVEGNAVSLRGRTPCGVYMAELRLQSDSHVSINLSSDFPGTFEVCDKRDAADDFLDSLSQAVKLQESDDELVLLDRNQQALITFKKVEPDVAQLNHTFWSDDSKQGVYFSVLIFDGDGSLEPQVELTKHRVCVNYYGSVTVGDIVRVPHALGVPMLFCMHRVDNPLVEEDEEVYKNRLMIRLFASTVRETANVEVDEGRLRFVDGARNETMNFKRLPDLFVKLHGTSWPLDDDKLMQDDKGTDRHSTYDNDHRISFYLDAINMGSLNYDARLCDLFKGSIVENGGRLEVGMPVSTLSEPCGRIHKEVNDVFSKVTDVQVQGDSLFFLDVSNTKLLTFRRLNWSELASAKR